MGAWKGKDGKYTVIFVFAPNSAVESALRIDTKMLENREVNLLRKRESIDAASNRRNSLRSAIDDQIASLKMRQRRNSRSPTCFCKGKPRHFRSDSCTAA